MTQRYQQFQALDWMSRGCCPECGLRAEEHPNDRRFWVPRNCDLLPHGVTERIAQYEDDIRAVSA